MRRRQRRLRSFDAQARHSRSSTRSWQQWSTTRTAPHGDRRQPPGPGQRRRETYSAPRRQEPPLPAVTTGTQFFTLDDESVPVTGVAAEPRGPQERVQRHIVEHIVDVCLFVQILGVPVPQMGNQLVERQAGHSDPRSGSSQCPRSLRTESRSFLWTGVVRRGRNSWWKCRLSCFFFLQQQSAEQIIDIPVPGTRGDHGGLQGFHPRQRSLQRTVEQTVDIPADGGLQLFIHDPGFASSAVSREELGQLIFRTFHRRKKCEGRRAGECGAGWARHLIHAERSPNGSCWRCTFRLQRSSRSSPWTDLNTWG